MTDRFPPRDLWGRSLSSKETGEGEKCQKRLDMAGRQEEKIFCTIRDKSKANMLQKKILAEKVNLHFLPLPLFFLAQKRVHCLPYRANAS